MKAWAAVACNLTLLLFWGDTYALIRVLDLRYWSAPDHTRIVLDLSAPTGHKTCDDPDPQVLAWWIEKAEFPGREKIIPVDDLVVKKVSLKSFPGNRVQISVVVVQTPRVNVFPLKKYLDKPDRLVIDLHRPDLEGKEKENSRKIRDLKTQKVYIIVIDPGHGGEDPGTIGPKGTREKDIVLELGKKLQGILNQEEGIRAFLTRKGDYFIPLAERVRIAREYGVDLLISLHCNGNRKKHLRGTSVYCLSLKGASDVAARLLANKENASDLLGGTDPQATATGPLGSILVDLAQTSAINNSLRLGGMALSEAKQVNALQFKTPKQAGFAVLQAPDFPSILVECAYLTNPEEELLLRRAEFQDRLAQALAKAAKAFLPLLAVQEKEPARTGH